MTSSRCLSERLDLDISPGVPLAISKFNVHTDVKDPVFGTSYGATIVFGILNHTTIVTYKLRLFVY